MAGQISQKLAELGISVPVAQAPVANYVPFARTGNVVVISGQLPMVQGKLAIAGKVGDSVTVEQGQEAARLCFMNILAHLSSACDGDLDRVVRLVRLGGFVACTPGFTQHPAVVNGASDLAVEIFGAAGRHARAAVGVASLPLDAAVEVEAMFEVK